MKKKTAGRLPKISIVTPSFNQGQFIEQTILSVLSQEYPNLEYIVIDGGSTDNTLKILRKYHDRLVCIIEPDQGQSDAINKGLALVTGDIVAYINSDDYLEPGSLAAVARFFSSHQDARWVTGKCRIVDKDDKEVRLGVTAYKNIFLHFLRFFPVFCVVQFISQPATFWRIQVVKEIGKFDTSLHYDMDYDYWLRLWNRYPLCFLDSYLASYRVHSHSKAVTSPETQFRTEHEILSRHIRNPLLLILHKVHIRCSVVLYRWFFIKR